MINSIPTITPEKQPTIEYILIAPKIVNLTMDKQNHTQVAGSEIFFNTTVLSDRMVIYEFKKNGVVLNNNSNNSTFKWKTDLNDIGKNIIEVLVKDLNDTSWIKSDRCMFEILDNNPPTVSISKYYGHLCFQAEGMDKENDPLEFKFILYDDDGKFLRFRDWSNDSLWVIPSLKSNNYKIEASVRDELHKWDNITSVMYFTVTEDQKRSTSSTKTNEELTPKGNEPADNSQPQKVDEPSNDEQQLKGDKPDDTKQSTENEPTVKTPSPPGPIERSNVIIGTIIGKLS